VVASALPRADMQIPACRTVLQELVALL